MLMTGKSAPRDTDMQAKGLAAIDPARISDCAAAISSSGRATSAIMKDAKTLLHANGHTMNVALERLDDAITRIG